jgi:hypothetical protein
MQVVQYYFLMTPITFPYGFTGFRSSFARRSLDPTEGNRGKYGSSATHGYAAVLGRRETLLENIRAEFESPAAHENFIDGWVETSCGRTASLTLLYATKYTNR